MLIMAVPVELSTGTPKATEPDGGIISEPVKAPSAYVTPFLTSVTAGFPSAVPGSDRVLLVAITSVANCHCELIVLNNLTFATWRAITPFEALKQGVDIVKLDDTLVDDMATALLEAVMVPTILIIDACVEVKAAAFTPKKLPVILIVHGLISFLIALLLPVFDVPITLPVIFKVHAESASIALHLAVVELAVDITFPVIFIVAAAVTLNERLVLDVVVVEFVTSPIIC
jgi:hypothetical protein